MLAVTTHNGTSLIDPVSFKSSSTSFPISTSLECSTNVWSPDNSQLYLASSSSIRRFSPSGCLLEELYCGFDSVTCLAMKGESSVLFFAAASNVWSLDCTCSPGEVLASLEPHKKPVTRISMSNDGTLLASVSASAVFVHNLALSSHVQLKRLPERKPVTCCLFHQHAKTRLLLGVGRDLFVYDSMRPSSPLKTVRIPGDGNIVGVAASPFSKTLVAVVTSDGDVALVDLDKDSGILKTVNVKTQLTCCAFTAEGAAIYLGAENGKLLILDLRSLDKEPKSFTIGEGSAPIKEINVQTKSVTNTASAKVKSNSTAGIKSSPQRSASSTQAASVSFVIASHGIKSLVRVTAAPKIRGGGGVIPKKKHISPTRSPLSETKNFSLDGQAAASRSPLSRHIKPLRLQRSKEQEENRETHVSPTSPTSRELANLRQRTKPSLSHEGQGIEHPRLGSAPESISGHLATKRVQSDPRSSNATRKEGNRPGTASRRTISETVESASIGRKLRFTSIGSPRSKVSSSEAVNGVAARTQQKPVRRSATPDNGDDDHDLSSPELPCEPVTPISLGKNAAKAPLASAAGSSGVNGVLGLTSPETAKWVKIEKGKEKGKEQVIEAKKIRFAQDPSDKVPSAFSTESEDEGGPGMLEDGRQDEEQERELSLQVSPRRPAAPPSWLRSPHRPSTASLNMNAAAQDFLRSIVHDVMYDFQRETKAEMMGLHLDLVRMGRGWKQELREIMGEWSKEVGELKAENRRLKEENERLQRGY